jgi:hypothetical protein
MTSATSGESSGTQQSLNYPLSGRSGLEVTKGDIGGIIGKGAQGLKKTITAAWSMYEQVQKSDKKVDEKKPTLRIVLKETSEGVEAEIISSSETMRKLAQLSLDNHLKAFFSTKSLQSYTFVSDFPHSCLGQLIGKKASGLNRILKDVYTGNSNSSIVKEDIDTAMTARLRIKELDFESVRDLSEFVKTRRNTVFIGWPPEEDEEYTDHISLTVTFDREAKPFVDITTYIQCLQSLITDRIQQIQAQHESQMDEINECLGFD